MEETQQDALVAGRYELGELLGTGGMSEVHGALDHRLQRPVAIKRLKPDMAARDDVRARFETEARWAARLSHPHAVAVYDTGEEDGVPYLVMERLPGETLQDRIVEGPVDPDWLRHTAIDVLGAIGAAHECGIVHRDIKPANILITPDGRAKVADFGIAKSLGLDGDDNRTDITRTGQLVGTPSYLAPERLDGEPADARSDIYALGVVLYEALTGRKPFSGATPLAVAFAVKHDDPVPLSELRPDADPRLVAAIERAMARDPAARFESAEAMAAVLDSAAGPSPAMATTQVVGADATVVLDRGDTVVGASPHPTTVVEAPAAAVAASAAPAGVSRGPRLSPRGRRLAWSVLALAAVVLIGVAAIAASSRNSGGLRGLASGDSDAGENAALVKQLRDVATRLEVGDGPRGEEAAARLGDIATTLSDGGDAGDDATALLADVRGWNDNRELGETATDLAVDTLQKVPGVDAEASATPPPTAAPEAPVDAQVNVGPRKGKGHGKKDD